MLSIIQRWLHWVWPTYCVLCNNITTDCVAICCDCLQELPWNHDACQQCALPLESNHHNAVFCGQCLREPPAFDRVIAPLRYEQPINQFITQLKFHQQLLYARLLGLLLARHIASQHQYHALPQCIIPVPLHRKRLRHRGYNQALEIARFVARQLQIPIATKLCTRIRHTVPQSTLSKAERRTNLKNAFSVIHSHTITHIAVIDDVMTTGQTLQELCYTLRHSGIEHIEVWCPARAL